MTRPARAIEVASPRPRRIVALIVAGAAAAATIPLATHRIGAEGRPTRTTPTRADPRLGIASTRVRTEVHHEALIFSGDRFPTLDLDRPAPIEFKLGPSTLAVKFFDRDGRAVTEPSAPGPYGAVVEITPEGARPTRRYLTLYKTARPLPPEAAFDPEDTAPLAEALGIDPKAVARQKEGLARAFRGRLFRDVLNDPAAARFLAGLKLSEREEGPVRSWSDAPAAERRWWVLWKRRALDLQGIYHRPLNAPMPTFGAPATTLREGTESEAGFQPGSVEAIDALLREWAANSDQAFAVCIARKGIIVLHRAYGMRDGKPMTVTTKSRMASVTKPMAASLVMMLVDQGLLALDDRIADRLPMLRGLSTDRPITVRHLFTHTHNLDFWLKPQDELPDFEERVADCYPSAHAGRLWSYNGVGFTVGGKIFEDLTGEALPDAYRKHLLGPLGMDDTDVTNGHNDARSIPLDIAKFGQMLLNGGAYGERRFFRESAFRTMLPQRLTTTLGPDTKVVYGIGLTGTATRFGHAASSGAIFQVRADDRLVVVMTRNASGKNGDKYTARFWEAIDAAIAR